MPLIYPNNNQPRHVFKEELACEKLPKEKETYFDLTDVAILLFFAYTGGLVGIIISFTLYNLPLTLLLATSLFLITLITLFIVALVIGAVSRLSKKR